MNRKIFGLSLLFCSISLWADELRQPIFTPNGANPPTAPHPREGENPPPPPMFKVEQNNNELLTEVQQREQERWIEHHSYQSNLNEAQTVSVSGDCLPYKRVFFAGFHLINPKLFDPKPGECLNEARLNQLLRDITKAYLDKGYVHNPLQFEDDHSDILTLRVFEGKVARLTSNKRVNWAQILPNAIGKPLKIQDLDQALDQLNRATGNNFSVDVLPAKNGEIELALHDEDSSRVAGSIAVDNGASKHYKRWQTKASLSVGEPFGLADSLYLNVAHSLSSAKNFTRSALVYYSIPYHYWTFNGFASISQFKMQLPLMYHEFEQRGHSTQLGINGNYVFHRGANHISTLSVQLEQLDSKNRFAGAVIGLQSPKLNNVQVGLNHLQLFENASLTFDLRHKQGWNSRKEQPSNKFNKWGIEAQLSRYQFLGEQLFRHTHQITAQYSVGYLPSSEQDDLTGRYRVRGFDALNVSAERNLVLHNTLHWLLVRDKWQFSPYIGWDVGISKPAFEYAHSERAMGYAIGADLGYQGWNANLEWASGRLWGEEFIRNEHSLFLNFSYHF